MNVLGHVLRHLLGCFLLLEVGALVSRSVSCKSVKINVAGPKLADELGNEYRMLSNGMT